MHSGSLSVGRLPFHLEGEQNIVFTDRLGGDLDVIAERAANEDSKLMAWLRSVSSKSDDVCMDTYM